MSDVIKRAEAALAEWDAGESESKLFKAGDKLAASLIECLDLLRWRETATEPPPEKKWLLTLYDPSTIPVIAGLVVLTAPSTEEPNLQRWKRPYGPYCRPPTHWRPLGPLPEVTK